MAVTKIAKFEDWYKRREVSPRDGGLDNFTLCDYAGELYSRYEKYKREMDARLKNYDKLVLVADAMVSSPKADLPNVSSGETAGMVRRMARNLVQNTPNVDIVSEFDDDSVEGIFSRFILKSKIIGDDQYSNSMQQNLFASAKNSLTLGFDCVVPLLHQNSAGTWMVKYDNVFYRDVFPEPGAKDVRDTREVFIRRYLTKGDVSALCRDTPAGWDEAALKTMLRNNPPSRDKESTDHQSQKHHTQPDGYEIITWYNSYGDSFLTFDARTRALLRIEKNKHPLKEHPVFFLVLEKDLNQPLGKSQVELVYGRQEFQDLMLNGAMKTWYRNINPPLIGYGAMNAVPNLGPGKYTQVSNPNAKIEAFEVNTQTLMQFNSISQQNSGSMVQLVGAADQQMAAQNGGGGMSQTPQGVEAQQAMVDITTNNYQKAIEGFFSRYCSYALTTYFQELKSATSVTPTADARKQLKDAGLDNEAFAEDGSLEIKFENLATEYYVRTVPGSLVELEDEKQIRLLNDMFIPLSQAMPAVAAAQDQEAVMKMSAAMQFIVEKQLELSGSAHRSELRELFTNGRTPQFDAKQQADAEAEAGITGLEVEMPTPQEMYATMQNQAAQIALLTEGQGALMQQAGIPTVQTEAVPAEV